MHKQEISTLTVRFNLRIKPFQLGRWRGAVAEDAGWEEDHFHNHAFSEVVLPEVAGAVAGQSTQVQPRATLKDRYQYRLPLIQYRVIKGQAAIFAIGQGVQSLRKWLLSRQGSFRFGNREVQLLVSGMQENIHELRLLDQPRFYRIMDYQALNQENYQRWLKAPDLKARIDILENCLAGHLLSFATGVGWQIPGKFDLSLMLLRGSKPVKVHDVERMAFNLVFKTNLQLPPGISLGRAVSHGFGVMMPTRWQQEEK